MPLKKPEKLQAWANNALKQAMKHAREETNSQQATPTAKPRREDQQRNVTQKKRLAYK